MDHLRLIRDPVLPSIKVPYICKRRYDGLSFSGYPERCRWDTTRVFNAQLSSVELLDAASFLQEWLYFGVLNEFFVGPSLDSTEGEPAIGVKDCPFAVPGSCPAFTPNGQPSLEILDFIDGPEIQGFITTRHLERYLSRWLCRLRHSSEAHRAFSIRNILDCLAEAEVHLSRTSEKISQAVSSYPSVVLSIEVLYNALKWSIFVLRSTFNEPEAVTQQPGLGTESLNIGTNSMLMEEMLRAGWCPNEVQRLFVFYSTATVYYLSRLRKAQGDHSQCSESVCVTSNIDELTYKTKHTHEDCACDHVALPRNEVESILRSEDSFPLTSYVGQSDGTFQLTATKWYPHLRYVAISHVWSDGLGNAESNSLPHCQLLRLKEFVYNLDGSELFWIDTLSVPVEAHLQPGQRQLRPLAISRMTKTYQEAAKVLVLDSELLRVCLARGSLYESAIENFARISCSTWSCRCWTLQEAVLPRDVCVQFLDGAFNTSAARRLVGVRYLLMSPPHDSTGWESGNSFDQFRKIKEMRGVARFAKAWHNLKFRSTSKKEDAFIILGTMLGLDTWVLLHTPPELRMKSLLSALKQVPKSLLYVDGERMTEDGWSWVPQWPQWGGHGVGLSAHDGIATVTKTGLKLLSAGYLLSTNAPHESFFFQNTTGDRRYYYVFSDISMEPDESEARRKLQGTGHTSLILSSHILTAGANELTVRGARVQVYRDEAAVLWAKYDCPIWINAVAAGLVPALLSREEVFPASYTDADQEWCVV